ncbi:MAG: iron chelate uptake ABC transporter family permease subunit [Nitrospirota bacterium]
MNKQKKYLFILIVGVVIACIIGVMVGPVFIHPLVVLKIWIHKISCGLFFQSADWNSIAETIVLDIRTPRVILAMLVGMGLAISGTAMQGLFRNPMAEPYVLGMSAGAATGATLAMVLGIGTVFGGLTIPAMAFLGATATIFVVYNIARTEGRIPTETLLLSGIAVGFFLYAVVSFLKLIASEHTLRDIVLWLMGSFASGSWQDVKIVALPILCGIFTLYLFSRELNVIAFGEEQALHLGVEVERCKRILLIASSLITAVSVAVSGIIGFVGLVIPHITRLIVGPNHYILLPASALGGAIFLVLADILARTVTQPMEIPIGIITAAIGAPYFVYLLRRRKKTVNWW